MPRFRVTVEKTIFVLYEKTFEAASAEDAETQANVQVEGLTMQQELPDLGWLEHEDPSSVFEVRSDLTVALTEPRDTTSDEFVIGGKSFYRNRRGRCEDAPCCGCCTI